MAKLIVWNLISLDGYFEGEKPWALDFHNKAWGPELEKLSEQVGEQAHTLIFGRKTYEGMASHWKNAEAGNVTNFMNVLPKLVASRKLTEADWNNTRVTSDIAGEIGKLKAGSDKDLYLIGSGELLDSLLQQGLIDELMLCVVPVLMGKGTPLFKGAATDLELIESRPLSNGGIVVRYAPKAG